jgi:hypothetical protein
MIRLDLIKAAFSSHDRGDNRKAACILSTPFLLPECQLHWSDMLRSASETLGFIKPELPTLVPEPPTGEGWIHEIKGSIFLYLSQKNRELLLSCRMDRL